MIPKVILGVTQRQNQHLRSTDIAPGQGVQEWGGQARCLQGVAIQGERGAQAGVTIALSMIDHVQ